ncbi:TolB-like 6-bladed beta-propeller domain-containing protein [Bacteroidales bacterium OttesenSCG-928-L03]|nr:TolB-like 6-bladed beta-propeller domain-containing protein [Bacteroidales bacterium OttesenSCG-928-L03]
MKWSLLKTSILLLFIFSLFVQSCNKENKIENKIFLMQKELTAKRINIEVLLDIIALDIKKEILIAHSRTTDTLFHLFFLPEMEYIKSFGTIGNGPNEYHSNPTMLGSTNNDFLYLRNNDIVEKINFQSLFADEIVVSRYRFGNFPSGSSSKWTLIDDSLIFYTISNPSEIQLCSYSIKNNKKGEKSILVTKENKHSICHENTGFLSGEFNTIAYAYLYKDQIDFMNMDFVSKKSIKDKKSKIEIDEEDINNSILYYNSSYIGQEKIYFLRRGHSINERIEGREPKNTIEVYDYEGNPIIQYHLNVYPRGFTVDEMNHHIYTWGIEEDIIYRYDMNQVN